MKIPAQIGDRIELTHEASATRRALSEVKYTSQLLDFNEINLAKLSMPIFENRLIPLEVGDEYMLCFFTQSGLYQCRGRIEKRYKDKNTHVMDVRFLNEIRKFQRRNYYRLDCNLDIKYRMLGLREQKVLQQMADRWQNSETVKKGIVEPPDPMEFEWNDGIVLNLSGGGVRFRCGDEAEPGRIFEIIIRLSSKNSYMPIHFLLKVITCETSEVDRHTYEIRGAFEYVNERERDILIQYVYEEQRRRLRKE